MRNIIENLTKLIWKLIKHGPQELIMEEYRRLILNSDAIEAAENWNDGIFHVAELGEIYIHVTQNKEQTFGISSILDDLEPENIIIFEVNLDILRQIEAYKARRPSLPCKGRFESYIENKGE